jgi:isocitrate/isopropylmalate dehydrogenase
MKSYTIAVIPGDGTGPEVIREGLKVLDALSGKFGIKFISILEAHGICGQEKPCPTARSTN